MLEWMMVVTGSEKAVASFKAAAALPDPSGGGGGSFDPNSLFHGFCHHLHIPGFIGGDGGVGISAGDDDGSFDGIDATGGDSGI